jgi:hypothetical protein
MKVLNHFFRGFDNFRDVLDSDKNEKLTIGNIFSAYIHNSMFLCVNNDYTGFFYRIGYLLWNLKGTNIIESLSYFGNKGRLEDLTDDGKTLKGAYGPRMRFWVGPDDLQEAINKNNKLSGNLVGNEFFKPKGIDQLKSVFEDLKNNLSSNIQIFNPSVDFDNSNNIPDLINIMFSMNEVDDGYCLNCMMNYNNSSLSDNFINDVFLVSFIQNMYSKFLKEHLLETVGKKCYNGIISVNVMNCDIDNFINDKKDTYISGLTGKITQENYIDDDEISEQLFGSDFTKDDLFEDLTNIYDFEKHCRMMINKKTLMNPNIVIGSLIESMLNKYENKFKTDLIRDMFYSIIIYAILKYTNTFTYKDIINNLYSKLKLEFTKTEIKNYPNFIIYTI